jgi:DNA-binding transcriptional ArsR family regulator
MQDERVREFIRRRVDQYFEECRELVELALDAPAELQRRAVAFLRRYWDESFAETWAELEPRLRADAEQLRETVAAGRLFELLEPLRSELRTDPETGLLERASRHEHEVEVTPAEPLRLIPSAYVWPHVRVNCDPPWPLALILPASFVTAGARRAPAPGGLVTALRAAGDPVRLQVLRLVAQRPRTTEELAPLVGLSASGLSKHLRALTEGGLVTSRRDGWYVLYSADRERVAALSAELLGYLEE